MSEDGKKYPPKYVVAVADHLANSTDISTESFNSVDAKNYLESLGFSIETKQQEKFELSITAESVESTDERFTMDNLSLGDNYKPLDACFKRANGDVIKRAYSKGERRNSNQTLPRIACQVFEKQLAALSVEDKENFPVCKYNPDSDVIRGIYASVDDFKKHRNTIEYLTYGYDNGRQFVIYCWNIFSTIIFVQECLKRFGEPGDQFVLIYREKDEKEVKEKEKEAAVQVELDQQSKEYQNSFSSMLIKSKNLIFRGAPGTGKSYLAKEIAADISLSDSIGQEQLMLMPDYMVEYYSKLQQFFLATKTLRIQAEDAFEIVLSKEHSPRLLSFKDFDKTSDTVSFDLKRVCRLTHDYVFYLYKLYLEYRGRQPFQTINLIRQEDTSLPIMYNKEKTGQYLSFRSIPIPDKSNRKNWCWVIDAAELNRVLMLLKLPTLRDGNDDIVLKNECVILQLQQDKQIQIVKAKEKVHFKSN